MLFIPKQALDYKTLRGRATRNTLIVAAAWTLLWLVIRPEWGVLAGLGGVMSYCYLLSLFLTTEAPNRKLTIVVSTLRTVTVSFLIVFAGQFRLLDMCLVFSGFLSYKVVLIVEYIRHSIGFRPNRGK